VSEVRLAVRHGLPTEKAGQLVSIAVSAAAITA
jgi:hypothetical protein